MKGAAVGGRADERSQFRDSLAGLHTIMVLWCYRYRPQTFRYSYSDFPLIEGKYFTNTFHTFSMGLHTIVNNYGFQSILNRLENIR